MILGNFLVFRVRWEGTYAKCYRLELPKQTETFLHFEGLRRRIIDNSFELISRMNFRCVNLLVNIKQKTSAKDKAI